MSPSKHPAGFLDSIDQLLSSDVIQALFLVDAVLMLIGMVTVVVLVWKHIQIDWWPKVFIEAAICFVGIGLSGTAFETYHIVRIVHEKPGIFRDSQKIDALSQTIDKTFRTVQEISQKVDNLSQTKCQPNPITIPPPTPCPEPKPPLTSPTNPPRKEETSAPSAPVRSVCPSPARATPEGWVYVGINLGRHWDKKHFDWDDYNKRLPEMGDILTATGLVNLRVKFGYRAQQTGTICPDEQVQVLETRTLSNSYHWVKVKRTYKKQGGL